MYLLSNWWNNHIIHLLGDQIFEARIIPLNKVWPDIPKIDQFRPIIILSHAYKWLELRFLYKIQRYL